MTVDQANYLKHASKNAEIFKGNMIMMLIAIITLIIFERILNRTDTKEVKAKSGSLEDEGQSFFGKEEMFKKASTERSMTVKLKTMKTSDLEIGDNSA